MFESLFGARAKSTLIDEAFETISGMLGHAGEMYDYAVATLLENKPAEVDLDEFDDRIDDGERKVRRTVVEHLSIDPQHDLVASLILVSIVQDAERLGDFARGLGDLVELTERRRTGPLADRLAALAREIRPGFELCAASFKDDDADVARLLIERHVTLKVALREYTGLVAASDLSADLAVVYSNAARILGRVSAHLSNIASSVVQPYDRIRHGDEEA